MSLFKNKYRIKSTRLPGWDYGSEGMYFVTVCTKNSQYYFGNVIDGKMALSTLGTIAKQHWLEIPKYFPFIELNESVIMPNHVHGILIINNTNRRDAINRVSTTIKNGGITKKYNPMFYKSLSRVIRWYKGRVTFEINKTENKIHFHWQPRFYDHIIRNEKGLYRIREYILNNPVKWDADEYNVAKSKSRRGSEF